MPTWPPRHLRAGDVVVADVCVVGAGVAGLVCALDLLECWPEARVVVVDKGAVGSGGSTPLAQGGMAVAVGADDSPARHAADTIAAGEGLNDPLAVAAMTAEGPARLADLQRRGAVFDTDSDGGLALSREGGQSVHRSVRAADATGAEIFRTLRAAAGRLVRIQGRVGRLARDADHAVCGAWVHADLLEAHASGPTAEGGMVGVAAGAVVLASGGCGGLYASTTNRDSATGDGLALAWRAGAELVDLEMVQFHPTGLAAPSGGAQRPLLTEALRGAGAVLLDRDGRRFMPDHHPDGELAPRHVVAKAIGAIGGTAWLDATALGAEVLRAEFPTAMAGAATAGFDLLVDAVPVSPVQHYLVGGIATDLDACTGVPGLLAVGEVASTGVHGANRMAGNSLLQACVFGHRAARWLAASKRPAPADLRGDTPADAPTDVGTGSIAELRAAMWDGAGPIRTAAGLAEARRVLADVAARPGVRGSGTADSVMVGDLICRSATLRAETRGVHVRADAPDRDPTWDGVRIRMRAPAP